MANYAIIENEEITNVIVADTVEIAEQVTGLQAVITTDDLVRGAGRGATFDAELGFYVSPSPFPSWIMNTESRVWEAPVPYPTDGVMYQWDETAGDWVATDYSEQPAI